jgi:hypothetical protein
MGSRGQAGIYFSVANLRGGSSYINLGANFDNGKEQKKQVDYDFFINIERIGEG